MNEIVAQERLFARVQERRRATRAQFPDRAQFPPFHPEHECADPHCEDCA